jgi:reductive dehalogenase
LEKKMSQDQETRNVTDSPESQAESQTPTLVTSENILDDRGRRTFLKRAALGGGGALLGGAGAYGFVKSELKGKPVSDYPLIDEAIFKPKDQRDTVLTFIHSETLNQKHPERNIQYNQLQNKDFKFTTGFADMYSLPWDNSKPGYTQLDRALQQAGWEPLVVAGSRYVANLQPDTPLHAWDQSAVVDEQYQFESEKQASDSIKSLYDIENSKELSWEKDFPFVPKTVIVMLVPMDYDAMATAPAWTADGTAADGYTKSSVLANQMAKFIQGLGYHAVGAGNDLGSSVPYGIMAGLGEGGRNGALLSPGIGPRHRICKVYTDFEFVEYDQPHTWGITDFCISCGKCAEACPPGAIPMMEDKNGGYGFEPSYEFSDEPGYTWNNHHGIQKFYSDAKKCYNFWVENGSACGACIASCTFNEPDMWHHVFIMGITPKTPGFLHALMAELHPKFGYGQTGDPKKAEKFWKTGEGMRTNSNMKNNIGTSNKS